MFFYFSKIASLFLEPLDIVFVILVVSALLGIAGRRRWAAWGIGAAIGFMAVIMFMPLDFWLMEPLEERFPVPPPPACLNGIILLGGGEDISGSARRGIALLSGAPMRYVVLSELMRRYPAAKVVFAGGSGIPGPHALAEADVARGLMKDLGLDLGRVTFESNSRTTWENAVDAQKLVHPGADERWVLLAPAAQLPRATGSFRKIGWTILPWPTDFFGTAPTWWPQSALDRIGVISVGEHEWLGLVAYWLTGRSSQLFPAPSADTRRTAAC